MAVTQSHEQRLRECIGKHMIVEWQAVDGPQGFGGFIIDVGREHDMLYVDVDYGYRFYITRDPKTKEEPTDLAITPETENPVTAPAEWLRETHPHLFKGAQS